MTRLHHTDYWWCFDHVVFAFAQLILLARGYKSLEDDAKSKTVKADEDLSDAMSRLRFSEENVSMRVASVWARVELGLIACRGRNGSKYPSVSSSYLPKLLPRVQSCSDWPVSSKLSFLLVGAATFYGQERLHWVTPRGFRNKLANSGC